MMKSKRFLFNEVNGDGTFYTKTGTDLQRVEGDCEV